MALPFDATLKDLVQRFPQDWLVGLNLPLIGPVEVVTPDLSTVTAFTDVVLKVGNCLLHLDFQTGPDPELPRRILLYNGLLYHRYGIPVHSVVILLRPRADRSDLVERLAYEPCPGRGGMDFRFEVVRVWLQPMEALLTGPLGLLPLATLGQVPEGKSLEETLPEVIARLVDRTLRESPPPQAPDLLSAAFILSGLRVSKDEGVELFQGVRNMQESSTYQAILEEGMAEGLAKGEAKGIQNTLLHLGRKQFGKASEQVEVAIRAITDLDRLERLTDRLLEVKTWQELLDTP